MCNRWSPKGGPFTLHSEHNVFKKSILDLKRRQCSIMGKVVQLELAQGTTPTLVAPTFYVSINSVATLYKSP